MKTIDPGHKYLLRQLGTDELHPLTFIKRSGGAIQYDSEWPGLQVQEVLRALIDRSIYLNDVIPCVETQDAIQYLRQALFAYEARAYRRKTEEKNRQSPQHDDSARPREWRGLPFDDVPFSEWEIEKLPIGDDGHVLTESSHERSTQDQSD